MNLKFKLKGEGRYMSHNDAVEFGRPKSIEDLVNEDVSVERAKVLREDDTAIEETEEAVEMTAVIGPPEVDVSIAEGAAATAVGGGDPTRTVVDVPTLSASPKPDFDPTEAQDARRNDSTEGGAFRSGTRHSLTPKSNVSRYIAEVDGRQKKTPAAEPTEAMSGEELMEGGVFVQRIPHQDFSESPDDGKAFRPESPNLSEKRHSHEVELTGFSARYSLGKGHRTVPVVAFYDNVETAMMTIAGMKYMTVVDGKQLLTDIVNGKPIIVKDERQVMEYVNGAWRKI